MIESIEHEDSEDCWCNPYLEYEDLVTGDQVWVHRDKGDAN
jgi:hypothetical protein